MNIKRSQFAALHDIIMAAISFALSLYLRLGENLFTPDNINLLISGTIVFTAICAIVFSSMRLYRGVWRYASVPDLIAITKAVTLSILIFLPLMFMITRLEGLPRSVLFINWTVLLILLGGPRFLYRSVKDRRLAIDFNSSAVDKRIPVLLAGINDNAELFLRETSRKNASDYRVVGIIDNDPAKIGRYLHNIRVYGDFTVIPKVVDKLRKKGKSPHKIVLTEEHPDSTVVKHLLEVSDQLGLSLTRLPNRSELKQTSSQKKLAVQPVVIEDLLGRAQTTINRSTLRSFITNRRVLVTGAGGTIGSELVRQIASYDPAAIILAEISEYNLYAIDRELGEKYPDIKRFALIADVRSYAHMDSIFTLHKPELVFHAAALKHVPIAEANPIEAVLTNTIGTRSIADCCIKHQVPSMVMISTDKAVNPTSIMGATKRIAESYCQALGNASHNTTTTFTTVRFGNVLGSSGSVIPLFQNQLEAGGPLTVTHPDMVRYFMTVREAVGLVLQASVMGVANQQKSAIFVLDMGEPVRIQDLATQMIRMAGLRPGIDIQIIYTGLRPGEKLYEELFYDAEHLQSTSAAGIMLASPLSLHYEDIHQKLGLMEEACQAYNHRRMMDILQQLVPEYQMPMANDTFTEKLP